MPLPKSLKIGIGWGCNPIAESDEGLLTGHPTKSIACVHCAAGLGTAEVENTKADLLFLKSIQQGEEVGSGACKAIQSDHDQHIAFAHEIQRSFKLRTLSHRRDLLSEDLLLATNLPELSDLCLKTSNLVESAGASVSH